MKIHGLEDWLHGEYTLETVETAIECIVCNAIFDGLHVAQNYDVVRAKVAVEDRKRSGEHISQ